VPPPFLDPNYSSVLPACVSSLLSLTQVNVTCAGKTYTMLGLDNSSTSLGVIPCAIDWLFRLINDQKEQTGARFSVRVSAVEITGSQEHLKDLLADTASGNYHHCRPLFQTQNARAKKKTANFEIFKQQVDSLFLF